MDEPSGYWEEYYSDIENLNKISKFCRYREVIIIKRLEDKNIALRPFKIINKDHLKYWIDRLRLTRTYFDLYVSNASIRLPKFPSDLRLLKKSRQMLNEQWSMFLSGRNNDFLTGFDIFADIDISDAKQRPIARGYAITIANRLKELGYRPQVWDTSRGYHIVAMGRFQPDYCFNVLYDICGEENIPTSISRACNDCGNIFFSDEDNVSCPSCGSTNTRYAEKPFVDITISRDIRRIRRCPYSLHSKTERPMIRIF